MKKTMAFLMLVACSFGGLETKENQNSKEDWKIFTFNVPFPRTSHLTRFQAPLLFGSFKEKFILQDNLDRQVATSTLHRLLPSKDPLYVIQDNEKILGYLQVKNWRLRDLFSPLSTLLYSPEGAPILKGEYPVTILPPSFKFYIDEYDEYVLHGTFPGLFTIKVCHKKDSFFEKMPIPLFYSLLQMHGEKSILSSPPLYSTCSGDIHIDHLSIFTEFSPLLAKKGVLDGEEVDTASEIEVWTQLRKDLEPQITFVFLEGAERNQIIVDLANKLTDELGETSPERVYAALDELTEAEKTVLGELINAKLDSVHYNKN